MSDRELSTPAEGAEHFAELYAELRRLAHAHMAQERPGHVLQTTALVHEVFVRLCKNGQLDPGDRRQFFLAAAQAMRRILIEHARARESQKRGGSGGNGHARPPARRISLDAAATLSAANDVDGEDGFTPEETLMLDEAVSRLEGESPEDGQVVRLRFYAGLSIEQVADVLGVSTSTVERRWRFARAWLWRALRTVADDRT